MIVAVMVTVGACAKTDSDQEAQAGTRAETSNPNALPFDTSYTAYRSVLDDFVRGGKVDYAALAAEREALDIFVSQLAGLDSDEFSSWNRERRLALWINAYNAITLRSITDHYPVATIRDIDGVWNETFWQVAGRLVTLDQIEHEIIRPTFGDPRIHFAVNCASEGCPPLAQEAYRGSTLDAQLDASARRFVEDTSYTRIDATGGVVKISQIFKWFAEDFIRTEEVDGDFSYLDTAQRAAMQFIYKHGDESVRTMLDSREVWKVEYLNYDWALNDVQESR
jgi:hypothetical protein